MWIAEEPADGAELAWTTLGRCHLWMCNVDDVAKLPAQSTYVAASVPVVQLATTARECKSRGNVLFQAGDFSAAELSYSDGMQAAFHYPCVLSPCFIRVDGATRDSTQSIVVGRYGRCEMHRKEPRGVGLGAAIPRSVAHESCSSTCTATALARCPGRLPFGPDAAHTVPQGSQTARRPLPSEWLPLAVLWHARMPRAPDGTKGLPVLTGLRCNAVCSLGVGLVC
jgi:hypothetical protein